MARDHRSVWTVLVLAPLLIVTACTSAGGSPENEAGPTGPSSGHFSVAGIEPDSLIPGKTTNGQLPMAALFTPLVGIGEDGDLQYLQASAVEGSDQARTWKITIRDGWTFHNGEPVTAESYVDAWNYTAYAPHAFPNSGQLANIVGYADLNPSEGKPKTKQMSGLEVLGEDAFVVRLVEPDSQFPYKLTANGWGFYPLPQAAYDDLKAYNEEPIGDGPYQMSEPWNHDQTIAMTAYPDYAGENLPQTKDLTFKLYADAGTAYTDVLAGNTDLAAVPADKLSQFKQDFPDQWLLRGGLNIEYLSFPLFDERWQDADLRRAISMSIDRDAINQALFGGVYGNADSFLPPATPGGDPASCEYCEFDPDAAKELLASAGGFSGQMVVTYMGGYGLDQEYQAIANQIRQNLDIDVVAKPSSTISAYFTNLGESKYRSGPLYGSWGAAYPSAEALLSPNFTPTGIAYYGTYYDNPEVTELIAAGNSASSAAEAVEKYREAEAAVQADFPAIPLFFQTLPMVYSTHVTGVESDALANPIYTAVTVTG